MALEPEVVETLSPMVRRITANNPGVFTGPGTNTYLVGDGNVTVIDPGPAMDTHAQAIADAPGTITQIIVTHTHLDHSPGAQLLQKKLGVPAYGLIAAYPQHQDPTFKAAALLKDQQIIEGKDFRIRVIHTPGHASNHLCFLLEPGGSHHEWFYRRDPASRWEYERLYRLLTKTKGVSYDSNCAWARGCTGRSLFRGRLDYSASLGARKEDLGEFTNNRPRNF